MGPLAGSGMNTRCAHQIRRAVVRSESVRNIIRERRMLEHLNHPFLCNLRYSFQDIEYLYVEEASGNVLQWRAD